MDAVVAHEPRARRIALPSRGGEMAALEFGSPDRSIDIIFSHANGFNARTYRSILAPLADHLRILAIDLRGHGRTALPTVLEGRNSWDELGGDLLAVLQAVDAQDVVLSGHSMGGTSSLLAAAQAPERVRSLVLFDPVILPEAARERSEEGEIRESPLVKGALKRRAVFPSKPAVIEAYTGRGAFKTWAPQMLADYVADGFRETADGEVELTCAPEWEASNFMSQRHDTWAAFDALDCPIRILRAEHGSTARIDEALDALTASGRVRVETVPGTSHFLPMERPELVRDALRAATA